MSGEAVIASFVVRFTREGPTPEGTPIDRWRVLVRHIQTGEERLFGDFTDASAFIRDQVDTVSVRS